VLRDCVLNAACNLPKAVMKAYYRFAGRGCLGWVQLSLEKTRITHINEGFDFLGCTRRSFLAPYEWAGITFDLPVAIDNPRILRGPREVKVWGLRCKQNTFETIPTDIAVIGWVSSLLYPS
jgi:hypothetical protein